MKYFKLYENFDQNKINEEFPPLDIPGEEVIVPHSAAKSSTPQPHVLHTMLVLQAQLKLAHWQTKKFPQHKALDEAYESLSAMADLLAESYIGKYGDAGRYFGNRTIELADYAEDKDFHILVPVLGAMIRQCAEHCFPKDSELNNIVDEMIAEIDKLQYLFTLN